MLSQSSLCLPAQSFLQCFCLWHSEDALHPTGCSDVKLLIKQPRHSILQRKIRIISTSGESLSLCSALFGILLPSTPSAPSLLASGKAKHLHCTCLCAHQSAPRVRTCVSAVAEFIILFRSFSPDESHDQGETAPKYNQEYFILFGSFPLHRRTFLSLLKSRDLPLSHLPSPFMYYFVKN